MPRFDPQVVRVAADALIYHGGDLGPLGDKAMAKALEAAVSWLAEHQPEQDQIEAALATAKRRAAVHIAASGRSALVLDAHRRVN